MAKTIEKNFVFSDGENHAANLTETSETLGSCYNYIWSISPLINGIAGVALYTIEVSNDDINWYEYNSDSTNVNINNAVDDNHLAFTKIRVKHIGGGATAGTVTYKFVQKDA